MPLMQGGPPMWAWERTPDPLKWEIVPFERAGGGTHYALAVRCGLEIMRLQLLSGEELKELAALIGTTLGE